MSANRWGKHFQVTTFGESHGPALGAVITGCPRGLTFDQVLLENELNRRKPGQTHNGVSLVSARAEADQPQVLSGIDHHCFDGSPLTIVVRNHDARSQDYHEQRHSPRPGHADDTWRAKFGHVDHRGGGRASGRETVARVMAGAVAQMISRQQMPPSKVVGFSSRIGPIALSDVEIAAIHHAGLERNHIDTFAGRMPEANKSAQVQELLIAAKQEGHSYGGEVRMLVRLASVPRPSLQTLQSALSSAFLGVGATAAVTLLNQSLSERETELHYQILFKPTASVLHTAQRGRHDPCIIPRAIPVLEAMADITLLDHQLSLIQTKLFLQG